LFTQFLASGNSTAQFPSSKPLELPTPTRLRQTLPGTGRRHSSFQSHHSPAESSRRSSLKTVPAGQRNQSAAAARAAFVGPNVTVDKRANLEAGAIVLKDVKPWMIVIENTARD